MGNRAPLAVPKRPVLAVSPCWATASKMLATMPFLGWKKKVRINPPRRKGAMSKARQGGLDRRLPGQRHQTLQRPKEQVQSKAEQRVVLVPCLRALPPLVAKLSV